MSASAAAQLAAQGASREQVAAIVAAIVRFTHDTAPPGRAPAPAPTDRWRRAARLEDAGGGPAELPAWGDPHPWGRAG